MPALCLAGIVAGCGAGGSVSSSTSGVEGKSYAVRSRACERNPNDGVHSPDRLKVLEPCAVFQGTVSVTPVKNPDGDVSFDVKPDPGYANMLNAHNRSEGGLHIEVVPRDQPGCVVGKPVHVGDVPGLGVCSGRDIAGPALGAHVRIIGPWVLDRNNDWYEIHPTWKITAAGCRVPRVVGKPLRRARAAIVESGCSVGKITRRPARARLKGHVLAQHPRPGSLVGNHTAVDLTVGGAATRHS